MTAELALMLKGDEQELNSYGSETARRMLQYKGVGHLEAKF